MRSVGWNAASAADSAARRADYAATAACNAARAADAAARGADADAASAAYERMADKLIALIKAAPVTSSYEKGES